MFLTYLMLAVALSLSMVAAFYSIIGLAAIFAAAVVPIVIMGSILEVAKLTVTVWLHEYWRECRLAMKAYLVPAVAVLMLITSMGIFGFLSKAHLDQAVPAGDISAQVTIFDDKIKTQRDNIEAARAALRQLDAAVDQTMGRSNDERGAERAVQIRRSQQAERTRLQTDIQRAQTEITRLQEQRAPIAAQARKVEAEVGPSKYIAALIYGDNPDANLLEKAVRWVIIILVLVFDPLAVMMLLAATESYKWERERRQNADGTVLTREQPQTARERLMEWRDRITQWRKPNDTPVDDDGTVTKDLVEQPPGPDVDVKPPAPVVGQSPAEPLVPYQIIGDADPEEPSPKVAPVAPIEPDVKPVDDLDRVDIAEQDDEDPNDSMVIRQAKRLWKQDNPGMTLKEQRRLLARGMLDHEPWLDYLDDPRIQRECHFGESLPAQAYRGDMFLVTSVMPTALFKHTGDKWIAIDKTFTDQYAFNDQYIDYLIAQLAKGAYDADLLTEAERGQIELKLNREV